MKVKRALISVSDKTGVVELGKALAALGIEIISTGRHHAHLKGSGRTGHRRSGRNGLSGNDWTAASRP